MLNELSSPEYKQRTIADYARRAGIDVLVETGSYVGDTIEYARGFFRDVYSVELGRDLHEHCKRRFAGCRNVHLFQGDSAEVLPAILRGLHGPAVFWLDGHWADGYGAARGPEDCPIRGEIDALVEWGRDDIVVLIDDVREFGVKRDYPPMGEVRERLLAAHPGWVFEVEEDIARAHRPFPEGQAMPMEEDSIC